MKIQIYDGLEWVEVSKNGRDGETPSPGELLPYISSLIPEIKDGKDGKDGVDGKDATATDIQPLELIEKINKSRKGKIKRDRIEGFDDVEQTMKNFGRQMQNIVSLGGNRSTKIQRNGGVVFTGVETLNFTNATLTPRGDGTTVDVTTTGGGGGGFTQADLATPDGTTVTFTTPAHTTMQVFLNGILQRDGGANYDYTDNNTSITFNVAPLGTADIANPWIRIYYS